MKAITFLFSTLLIVTVGRSQINFELLDSNNVSANISNAGIFFSHDTTGHLGYEVPKGSGNSVIYAMGFWFAGVDQNGVLRNSCTRYIYNGDLFPGPYSETNSYTDPIYVNHYANSMWSVTKAEVLSHQLNWNQPGYTIPMSILNWPGNGQVGIGVSQHLAPYVDVNSNGIYEPEWGDFPDIRGDKAVYVINNDAANVHTDSNGNPMGIEVHSMFYQYASANFLDTTTFFNVRVFNRGSYNYTDFRMAIHVDGDLGCYSDDYVGCDTTRNMMFTYNGDNLDQCSGIGSTNNYGSNPPVAGVISLRQNMKIFGYFTSTSQYPYNDPVTVNAYWNLMHGKWNNGSPWYYGGLGYAGSTGVTTQPTNYMFTGDPETASGWTEFTNSNNPGDRRIFMVMDSIELNSGSTNCYDYAVLWRRGSNNLNSVTKLKEVADDVKTWFDNETEFNCSQVTMGINEQLGDTKMDLWPNPSNGIFELRSNAKLSASSIYITDAQGRNVYFDLAELADAYQIKLAQIPGVYFLTIQHANVKEMIKLVVR